MNRWQIDPEHVTLFRGQSVLILGPQGWAETGVEGFYFRQTRFVQRFSLTIAGEKLRCVGCVTTGLDRLCAYYLAASPAGEEAGPRDGRKKSGGEIANKAIEFWINTYVGSGYHQEIWATNHSLAAARFDLDLAFEADFADMQEASIGERQQSAPIAEEFCTLAEGGARLNLSYQHPKLKLATQVALRSPSAIEWVGRAARSPVALEPGKTCRLEIDVCPSHLGETFVPWFSSGGAERDHSPLSVVKSWRESCSRLEASASCVQQPWDRAVADLEGLLWLEGDGVERLALMAGIPKFTGLFGRDCLMAGLQSSMLNPATLQGGLAAVRKWNAEQRDDRFDAEPGKVLHQRDQGPLALLGLNPFAHYYGDASAPALFLIAAAFHLAHTGNVSVFADLRAQLLGTLEWMDDGGDIDGDGFYEYRTRAGSGGLKNQGWKDSGQAILYPDGSMVDDPIAVAEVQGLYYLAKQALGCAFAATGEAELADRLFAEARTLKTRFNAAFWMPDEQFFALALDSQKRQVKTIASNPGFCLACGIIDEDKSTAVALQLLGDELFSGWGVRTLSAKHPAFNPFGYHLGTIWPVSTAHACAGLKRYGFHGAFHRVAKAIFDAAALFENDRLPEAFGGHTREPGRPHPGVYPGAGSPQAWSASAIVQICHLMIGALPLATLKTLILDPCLPDWLPQLTLRELQVGDERVSISLRRTDDGETEYEILAGGQTLRIERVRHLPEGRDRFAAAFAEVASSQ